MKITVEMSDSETKFLIACMDEDFSVEPLDDAEDESGYTHEEEDEGVSSVFGRGCYVIGDVVKFGGFDWVIIGISNGCANLFMAERWKTSPHYSNGSSFDTIENDFKFQIGFRCWNQILEYSANESFKVRMLTADEFLNVPPGNIRYDGGFWLHDKGSDKSAYYVDELGDIKQDWVGLPKGIRLACWVAFEDLG